MSHGSGPLGHIGYVAGRYRGGVLSDSWTDVTRCAERTFVSYLPACECGWIGTDHPATPDGHRRSRHEWADRHLPTAAPPMLAGS
jgi:hypothetical protein